MRYLDRKLIDTRPANEIDNEQFVDRTIRQCRNAHSRETLSLVARIKNVNKNKEKYMTKLLAMPKLASLALVAGIVTITGGAAYATVNWFGTNVETEQKSDIVYSVATECSPSTIQALQNNQSYTNTTQYKIVKPELITQEDLKLDELSTCEQRAIETNLRAVMPEIYQPGDSKDGLYYPVGRYGKVVNATENEITVAQIPVDHQKGNPEIITATIAINSETLVTNKGDSEELQNFKQGDSVYIIFQNSVRSGQNDNDLRDIPSDKSTIRAVAKTQYDMGTIKEKVNIAASENAFEVVEKSE